MNTIIISAVNLTEGGTLSILKSFLQALSMSELSNIYRVIALVNNKDKILYPNIEYIELPKAKKRWLYRIYYEYFYFKKISNQFDVYLWLSLHDMSPNVKARRRAVYMHNPSPFFRWKVKDVFLSKKYVFFAMFYKWAYRINIHQNDYLIVQQDWLRKAFSEMFNVDQKKIIVARPYHEEIDSKERNSVSTLPFTFFFPALARPFKNFEVICEAVIILNKLDIKNFRVVLTIDGTENSYSNHILEKYKSVLNIEFVGLLRMEQMHDMYLKTDVLLFPSKLETWGLPISEFKEYRKPMIIADLEYAHETSEGSLCTAFFDVNSPQMLAELMIDTINDNYIKFSTVPYKKVASPYVVSYYDLMLLLLK